VYPVVSAVPVGVRCRIAVTLPRASVSVVVGVPPAGGVVSTWSPP